MFENFHGNERVVGALGRMIEHARVPQTLLLAGPAGVGKATLARRFAARLLGGADKIEKDDLSLLSGLTETARSSHRSKGIFTVTQLSYTFKSRRPPKRAKNLVVPRYCALQALAIRERVYGPVHPNVASTVNELGNIAIHRAQYDEAERHFRRMLDIYHSIYGDKHYLIGIATSNLAGAYMGRKDYARAEHMYRDAVRQFSETQGPEHLNTGIARAKLGRALLRQRKFTAARDETLAGYMILTKQANPSISFIQNAKKDLVAEYDSLGKPDEANKYK